MQLLRVIMLKNFNHDLLSSSCLRRHAPESLQYMSNIRNTAIFRFCAIPQVMAIATLAEIYNNPNVFTGKDVIKHKPCTALT